MLARSCNFKGLSSSYQGCHAFAAGLSYHKANFESDFELQADKSMMCNYVYSPNDCYIGYNCTRPFGINVIDLAAGALCLHKDITMKAFEPSLPGSLPGQTCLITAADPLEVMVSIRCVCLCVQWREG